MRSKEFAKEVVERLERHYPEASCALQYEGEPFKLMIMGRLSAQCTDHRVNIVCNTLFARYPTAEDIANAELDDLEQIVRPCGLYRMKAAQIKEECRILVNEYGGVLPSDMETLLTFPGIGRKIANLLRGDIFGLPAIVADTHCIRISGKLGLVPPGEKRPEEVEKRLVQLIEPEKQSDFCHRLVMFGRDICSARNPACEVCPLADLCKS